jgi:hypothetical protein
MAAILPAAPGLRCGAVHPTERTRIVVETARAVLDGRLDAVQGVQTLAIQEQQIAPHLRSDRIDVTQSEADAAALTLRHLGEQISDLPTIDHDQESLVEMARILGSLAQTLR